MQRNYRRFKKFIVEMGLQIKNKERLLEHSNNMKQIIQNLELVNQKGSQEYWKVNELLQETEKQLERRKNGYEASYIQFQKNLNYNMADKELQLQMENTKRLKEKCICQMQKLHSCEEDLQKMFEIVEKNNHEVEEISLEGSRLLPALETLIKSLNGI